VPDGPEPEEIHETAKQIFYWVRDWTRGDEQHYEPNGYSAEVVDRIVAAIKSLSPEVVWRESGPGEQIRLSVTQFRDLETALGFAIGASENEFLQQYDWVRKHRNPVVWIELLNFIKRGDPAWTPLRPHDDEYEVLLRRAAAKVDQRNDQEIIGDGVRFVCDTRIGGE
jgi:hypothetical protein